MRGEPIIRVRGQQVPAAQHAALELQQRIDAACKAIRRNRLEAALRILEGTHAE
jgi:hypothetical protein